MEQAWCQDGSGIAFLSVRSALDALLTAQNWPAGDEVLVSAVTISDMPRIIAAHGLAAVAVDVDPHTLAPDLAVMTALLTQRTRALMVADLFGGQLDLGPAAEFARQHGLLLIQDAAQALASPADCGHPKADVALYSFGTLKTATALGGALVRVRDSHLAARMRAVQATWPAQTTAQRLKKLRGTALLLAVQTPLVYTGMAAACRALGTSSGAVVRRMTRGFGHLQDGAFLEALRVRPHPGQLRFLAWRLSNFDAGRLDRRARCGEELVEALPPGTVAGAGQHRRTHWLVPISAVEPDQLRATLLAHGIDASGASNVTAVGGRRATELIARLVFVPAYPEMPRRKLAELIQLVKAHGLAHPRPTDTAHGDPC